MKKLMLVMLLGILAGSLTAQDAVWYFGNQGGVTFTNCAPNPSGGTNILQTTEGSTIVSDRNNNVLFYSDGVSVYDESGNTLTSSLLGGKSSTQAALAVPIPSTTGNPRFLIFTTVGVEENLQRDIAVAMVTTSSATYPYGVSMTTSVASYIYPYSSTTMFWSEKLACTPDGNNGYWVVAHNYSSTSADAKTFYKYHLTLNDPDWATITNSSQAAVWLAANGITQTIPGSVSHNLMPENAMGQMKFSNISNGTAKLGLVLGGYDIWEVYQFNLATGWLDNRITPAVSSVAHGYYGCEFSPDGNLFYTTDGINKVNYQSLRQWDLSNPLAPVIIASNNHGTHDNALQILRECNRIYAACPGETYPGISVIQFPNVPGTGCGYSENSVNMAGWSKTGLPSYYVLGSTIPDVPCQCKENTSAGPIIVPVKSNGEGMVDLYLNSGDMAPTYIRIDWANFEVTTTDPDCRKYCGMSTENMGMIVNPLPPINDFTPAMTPWFPNAQPSFTREIVYTNPIEPRPIRDMRIRLNLKFPFISDLACCEAHYFGSFMVTYLDRDCRMCQTLVFAQSDSHDGTTGGDGTIQPAKKVSPEVPVKANEVSASSFSVYPNPNDGTFTISTKNLGTNLPYEVLDAKGSNVTSGKLNGETGKIDLSRNPAGAYYVRITSGSGVKTEKVVVSR